MQRCVVNYDNINLSKEGYIDIDIHHHYFARGRGWKWSKELLDKFWVLILNAIWIQVFFTTAGQDQFLQFYL